MGHENFSQQLMFLHVYTAFLLIHRQFLLDAHCSFESILSTVLYSHATKLKLWMTSVILFFEVSHQWPAGWKLIRPWRNIAKKLKLVVHERNLLQNMFFRHIRSWRNRIFSGESKGQQSPSAESAQHWPILMCEHWGTCCVKRALLMPAHPSSLQLMASPGAVKTMADENPIQRPCMVYYLPTLTIKKNQICRLIYAIHGIPWEHVHENLKIWSLWMVPKERAGTTAWCQHVRIHDDTVGRDIKYLQNW